MINLKKTFGDKFKIDWDESRDGNDPWYMIIPCRLGHIYPFGDKVLAASVDGHPGISKRVSKLPFVKVHQYGDDGITVLFDVKDFNKIARIIKPKRRKQLSAKRKEELRLQLIKARSMRNT